MKQGGRMNDMVRLVQVREDNLSDDTYATFKVNNATIEERKE